MIASRKPVERDLDWVYRAHFTAVLSSCRRILRNEDDAADAAHEVFLRAMQFMPASRADHQIRPWLLTVARNHCIDVLRQRKRLARMESLDTAARKEIDGPEQSAINRDTAATLLAGLRLHERQALWQSAVEGQPLAGIARSLGLSYMAAAQVLHRARRRAVMAAAQVAAIIWVFTRRPSGGRATAAGRLIALVAVPGLAITISAATPPSQPATPAAAARHMTTGGAGIEAVRAKPPLPQPPSPAIASTVEPAIPSTVGPASTATIISAAGALLNAPPLTLPSIKVPASPPIPVPTPKLP